MARTLPAIVPTSGLHTAPGDGATPNHCIAALNVFGGEKRLVKRNGMTPFRAMKGKRVLYADATNRMWAAWALADDTVVDAGVGTVLSTSADTTKLYIGVPAAKNLQRVRLQGLSGLDTIAPMPTTERGLTVSYWNGTAWTTRNVTWLSKPLWDNTYGRNTCAPFVHVTEGVPSSNQITGVQLDFVWKCPDDWVASTFNSLSKRWLRIDGWANPALFSASINLNNADSWYQAEDNRILHILTWRDRGGALHDLVTWLVGGIGVEVRFTLDGADCTVDGFGSGADADAGDVAPVLYTEATKVWAAYHEPTNQVIGHVDGQWFTVRATSKIVTPWALKSSATEVTDTPYKGLSQGFLSVLPKPDAVAIHDGRVFVAVSDTLIWTAPGVYVDIVPANNVIFLGDTHGGITALAPFAGSLAAFKERTIWSVQFAGLTSELYTAAAIPGNKGCIGPIAQVGDYVAFLSDDGVYLFDSSAVAKISGAIDQVWRGNVTCGDWRRSQMVFDSRFSQLRLFYSQGDRLGAALYADLTRVLNPAVDEENAPIAWWPQGKYPTDDPTDIYGFNASCVGQGEHQTLLGDINGIVWTMDEGLYDGPDPVKCLARSAPVRLGEAQGLLVRAVVATFLNTGNIPWTLWTIFNEDQVARVEYQTSAYKSGVGRTAELATSDYVVNANDKCAAHKGYITREIQMGRRARSVSVGMKHESAGAMEWLKFSVEGIPLGRRAER